MSALGMSERIDLLGDADQDSSIGTELDGLLVGQDRLE